ncbi:MAG: TIGR04282 family arsenosugar biosynthesis glycosyltransferase [Acetobacteraceae bacterium]|nr:TIGR04282 family arsenosugar biosynthesis glycosyltransferase [Acetobacteraceae bacterium]
MRGTLILFARAPRLGTVKRRLARGIGAVPALRFHRTQLAGQVRTLGRDRRWRTVLAVTPDLTAQRGTRWPGGLQRQAQGGGDLGRRMGRALARHRPLAVLIGCDIPGIRPADIATAFRALRAGAPAVFGPSEDGGYWLVGLGARRPERPFDAVRWSTGTTLADTVANLRGPRPPALVRRLRDVDTVDDLRVVMRHPGGIGPGQGRSGML